MKFIVWGTRFRFGIKKGGTPPPWHQSCIFKNHTKNNGINNADANIIPCYSMQTLCQNSSIFILARSLQMHEPYHNATRWYSLSCGTELADARILPNLFLARTIPKNNWHENCYLLYIKQKILI